MLSGDIQ